MAHEVMRMLVALKEKKREPLLRLHDLQSWLRLSSHIALYLVRNRQPENVVLSWELLTVNMLLSDLSAVQFSIICQH